MNGEAKTTQTPQPSHPTQSPQSETVDKRPEPVSTTTPTRKRQNNIDPDDRVPPPKRRRQIDNDVEPQPKRARLTRKNLAAFDKMGKKKNSDPTDDSKSTKTKTTSTTTSGFAEKARKNGILPSIHSKTPVDLEDLRKQYARSRDTASPPESVYERYVNAIDGAGNEATIVVETSELLKRYDDKGYNRAFNRPFTNYPRDIGFNNGLSAPQPDFVEGLETEEYRPFPANNYIPGAALYQDDPRSITLPQIAGEWKGPAGDMKEARMQAAYDGAAMVHARAQALAYMGEEDLPGHAAVTTFTIDGTNLNLYAHYAAPAEDDDDTLEYHQYPISSTSLTSSYEDFKKGRKQLRNAQDHAKAQSEQLRDQLKQHWKKNRTKLPPVAEGITPPTDMEPPPHATDGYEDASPRVLQEEEAENEDDYEIVPPCRESSYHSSPHSSKSHHSSSKSSHPPGSESHKRKASQTPSQGSSHGSDRHENKHRSYWKKNANGYYYHRHSDGTITWYNDVKDHHRH